jgi:hypothetical protein
MSTKNLKFKMPEVNIISQAGPLTVRPTMMRIINSDEKDFHGTKKEEPWDDVHEQIVVTLAGQNGEGVHTKRFNTVGFAKPGDMPEDERKKAGYTVETSANGLAYLCKKDKDGSINRVKSNARTEQALSILMKFCAALGASSEDESVLNIIDEAIKDKCTIIAVFRKEQWDGKDRYEITSFRAPVEDEMTANVEEDVANADDV